MRQITEADGLPAGPVLAVAWMDDVLYLAIAPNHVVAFDLQTRKVEHLLVSGRIDVRHPLEKLAQPPYIRGIQADAPRGRVIFLVDAHDWPIASFETPLSGLWELRVDDGQWRHLLRIALPFPSSHPDIHPSSTIVIPISARMMRKGASLFLAGARNGAVLYDLETDQATVLMSDRNANAVEAIGDTSSPLVGYRASKSPPFRLVGNQLWTSRPFAALDLQTGEHTMLPAVTADSHWIRGVSHDDRVVLVGCASTLWALELKERDP